MNGIKSITLELSQVGKTYSITVNRFEDLNDLSLIAGTLTRLLYRKLELFKLHGKTPIALNRKTSFNIIVEYNSETESKRIFDITERLNVHNVGRLFREYESKFSMYLFVILSDALKPLEMVKHVDSLKLSTLPSKVVELTTAEQN